MPWGGPPRGSQSDWAENLAEAKEKRLKLEAAILKDAKPGSSKTSRYANLVRKPNQVMDFAPEDYLRESPLSYLDIFAMKEPEPIAHFQSGHHWQVETQVDASITSYRACGALKDEYSFGKLEMWLAIGIVGTSVLPGGKSALPGGKNGLPAGKAGLPLGKNVLPVLA